MLRAGLMLVLAGLLAACGADGDPVPPSGTVPDGITFSGEVKIGVSGEL